MTLELDAISVFVKVVESGSFTGAAQILKMPKTTVSAKVAGLEKRLGVTLIQRTTRKLHVTDAGQNYFKRCVVAIKEVEQAEADLLATQETPKGVLRVTAPADVGHSLLPRLVCNFLQKYPEVEMDLIVTNRIVDLVGEGIDLAMRGGDLKDSTLVARKFLDVRMCLVASPGYLNKNGMPDTVKALSDHRFVVHASPRLSNIEITDGKKTAALSPRGRIRVDDFDAMRSFLLMDEGIGWIPEFIVSRELAEKDLVRVLPKWQSKSTGQFAFVYPGQKYSSPKIRAFIDSAIDMCQEKLGLSLS